MVILPCWVRVVSTNLSVLAFASFAIAVLSIRTSCLVCWTFLAVPQDASNTSPKTGATIFSCHIVLMSFNRLSHPFKNLLLVYFINSDSVAFRPIFFSYFLMLDSVMSLKNLTRALKIASKSWSGSAKFTADKVLSPTMPSSTTPSNL